MKTFFFSSSPTESVKLTNAQPEETATLHERREKFRRSIAELFVGSRISLAMDVAAADKSKMLPERIAEYLRKARKLLAADQLNQQETSIRCRKPAGETDR